MISVEEAKNIIHSQQANWGTAEVLLTNSIGEVLAEDIYADRDFPPFDRVAMDGIAIDHKAFSQGKRDFQIQATQLAGEPALTLENPNFAIEIMTGAVLSTGCNLVIRYEDLEFYEGEGSKWVKINIEAAEPWKNVHRRGVDQKIGERLLHGGSKITAAEIAIMATVGKDKVQVKRKPKVAIISTGDELVDVDQTPLPHQIRKSNTVAIEASLNQLKIPNQRFHLLDNKEQLKIKIGQILEEFEVLLLSGGVSKGKADYLPEVLDELNVVKHFHRVAQKPGKPFWFGSKENSVQVFAFPGNPISTYMCFRVYFIPWLMQRLEMKVPLQTVELMCDITFKPDLSYFAQVSSKVHPNGAIQVSLESGNGSGDLANLAKSDAFIYLPKGKSKYQAGNFYDYFPFDISSFA